MHHLDHLYTDGLECLRRRLGVGITASNMKWGVIKLKLLTLLTSPHPPPLDIHTHPYEKGILTIFLDQIITTVNWSQWQEDYFMSNSKNMNINTICNCFCQFKGWVDMTEVILLLQPITGLPRIPCVPRSFLAIWVHKLVSRHVNCLNGLRASSQIMACEGLSHSRPHLRAALEWLLASLPGYCLKCIVRLKTTFHQRKFSFLSLRQAQDLTEMLGNILKNIHGIWQGFTRMCML